jgi:hypothetical protein
VTAVWVPVAIDPEDLRHATQVDRVEEGHNVVFLQADNDAGLSFRQQRNELWVVNRFRLYVDLLDDPRRGREQADNLRREVIGF